MHSDVKVNVLTGSSAKMQQTLMVERSLAQQKVAGQIVYTEKMLTSQELPSSHFNQQLNNFKKVAAGV